jgi:hypothetical protein
MPDVRELSTRVVVVFLFALAGVAFTSHARLLWPFTVDDTFITLRYAARLAGGRGLSWNDGEAPVEGYTSFSWTLLLSPAHFFGPDAEWFAKLASLGASGLLCALLAACAAWLTPGSSAVRATAAALAAALFALDPSSAVHAVSGMDTALFALLLTLVFAALVAAKSKPTQRAFAALSAVGLLSGLTRPEGNLVFGVGTAVLLAGLNPEKRRQAVRALLLGYALPGAAYFAWRYFTYGLLFPLPVYAKAVKTDAFFAGLPEALAFGRDLVVRNPLWAACAVLGALALRGQGVPALCGAASLLLASLKPAPLMAYEHRYLYPLVPFLCCLAAFGLVAGSRAALRRVSARASVALPAASAAVVLCAVTAYVQVEHLRAAAIEFRDYGAGLRRAHVSLGRALAARRFGERTPSVALLDAGAIAYYSEWSVIDTFGLNDRHIALHGRGDAAYVLGRRPDALVVVSSRRDAYVPVFDYEAELHRAARRVGYVFWRSYPFARDYHLRVLVRPETPGFSS